MEVDALPRPCCKCFVRSRPKATVFKPAGIPARELEHVDLSLEEFEALRLSDLQGLYQAEAAKSMGVSRPTFSRIVERARRKVVLALVEGRALIIETEPATMPDRDKPSPEDAAAPARHGDQPHNFGPTMPGKTST